MYKVLKGERGLGTIFYLKNWDVKVECRSKGRWRVFPCSMEGFHKVKVYLVKKSDVLKYLCGQLSYKKLWCIPEGKSGLRRRGVKEPDIEDRDVDLHICKSIEWLV